MKIKEFEFGDSKITVIKQEEGVPVSINDVKDKFDNPVIVFKGLDNLNNPIFEELSSTTSIDNLSDFVNYEELRKW